MLKIFISDLHLEEKRLDIAEIFFKFIEKEAIKAQALYILGDLFESWIGDDDLTPFNQSIIDALKKATSRGLPIYLMHGNRDFLLGKNFLKATGCQLLKEEEVILINHTPTLLLHGDTLCTEDVQYLKFRKKARSFWFKKCVLLKSLQKRREMANAYREKSKMHTSSTPDYIMDVTQSAVMNVMKKYSVQHLIHGHTHREAVHHFSLNDKDATRTVLGAWHSDGSALICKENGQQELIHISY